MSCVHLAWCKKYLNINMAGGYKSSLNHLSAKLRFEVFWLSEQGLCSLFLLLVAPGYYNTIQLLEAIALHLDSANGKPCIWEELVSCFLRLFSDKTADYEDCISCTNAQGDKALEAFSKFSSFFFERLTRESWKVRCRWWMHNHFNQNAYAAETLTGSRFIPYIYGQIYTSN